MKNKTSSAKGDIVVRLQDRVGGRAHPNVVTLLKSDLQDACDEITRLRAMEQRLKSSFTRGTMDSPWLQRNSLHLGDAAVAFMRWVWTGEEPKS